MLSGGPARLSDRVCGNTDRFASASPRLESCPSPDRSCLPNLNLGPKCNLGSWVGELTSPLSISLAKPTPTLGRWVGVKWHGSCLKRKGPVEQLPCLGPPPPSCGPVQCVGILSSGHLGSLSIRCSFAHIWPHARSLDANCFELYNSYKLCVCVCARVLSF